MDKKLKQIYQAKIKQLKEEANIPKLGWDGNEAFKDKQYDIFISIHSLEHSWDLQGFIDKSLNHCKKTFVFLTPRFFINTYDPNRWDCIFLDFANREMPKPDTIQAIEKCFQGFKVNKSRISRHSVTVVLQRTET